MVFFSKGPFATKQSSFHVSEARLDCFVVTFVEDDERHFSQ